MSPSASSALASHHYFDRDLNQMAVKLLPAEYYVTSTNTVLSTVLGSCVAACLHDIDSGIAGMNHFMLPEDSDRTARDARESMRYGTYAMDVLIAEMLRAGARRERIQAKVFGGGAVLANMTTLNIGDRNSDFVLRYLGEHRIPVAAQDLRGPHARRVCFVPSTGKASVRKLRAQTDVQLVQRDEVDLLRQIVPPRVWSADKATATAAPTPAAVRNKGRL
jgi:chemotaxis protein CheD